MSGEQIDHLVSYEVALEDSHSGDEKSKYFGEVIEQDAIHNLFDETKACLHLAIDKATFTIAGNWFDKQEILNGFYHVFYQILTNYGIPYKFFTDNRTIFNYMSLMVKELVTKMLTQYSYDCNQLGIDFETASVS